MSKFRPETAIENFLIHTESYNNVVGSHEKKAKNDDITVILNKMVALLGVKEKIGFKTLSDYLYNKDVRGCVQRIAAQLGLPIIIDLTYIPKNFNKNDTNRFYSKSLAQTNQTGQGVEGIIAQVHIPQYLPHIGQLQGYHINVRVSEDCCNYPKTFVTIMAHELSHVLLTSLNAPYKDSEFHTDLVPILLGFRDIVRQGRKKVETTTEYNRTITRTTTYGYLTDTDFEYAYDYIGSLLLHYRKGKENLLNVVEIGKEKINETFKLLSIFEDYMKYLNIHIPKRMKRQHAERMVELFGWDHYQDWADQIASIKGKIERIETYLGRLSHYTSTTDEHMNTYNQELHIAIDKLNQIRQAINNDVGILKKYVGRFYRFRKMLSN